MTSRALVLGGGGLTGVCWEVGVLQGLADAGFDIEHWDLVVGTSAGSFVGARLAGEGSVGAMYQAFTGGSSLLDDDAVAGVVSASFERAMLMARRPGLAWMPTLWFASTVVLALTRYAARRGIRQAAELVTTFRVTDPDAEAWRRVAASIGALALLARRDGHRHWLDFWTRTLPPVVDWPAALMLTAVDTADGRRRTFDASSGVPVSVAVAASTCLPGLFAPVSIGGRRYMDGGVGSGTNADLARGRDEVLIVAPIDGGGLASLVAELESGGSRVQVIRPSQASAVALGSALATMDPDRREPASRAGHGDGQAAALEWLAG